MKDKRVLFAELTGTDLVESALIRSRPYDRFAWAASSRATWIDLYGVCV